MKKLWSYGVVRGILWQIAGVLLGMGFLTGVRLLMGLEP